MVGVALDDVFDAASVREDLGIQTRAEEVLGQGIGGCVGRGAVAERGDSGVAGCAGAVGIEPSLGNSGGDAGKGQKGRGGSEERHLDWNADLGICVDK